MVTFFLRFYTSQHHLSLSGLCTHTHAHTHVLLLLVRAMTAYFGTHKSQIEIAITSHKFKLKTESNNNNRNRLQLFINILEVKQVTNSKHSSAIVNWIPSLSRLEEVILCCKLGPPRLNSLIEPTVMTTHSKSNCAAITFQNAKKKKLDTYHPSRFRALIFPNRQKCPT